MTTDADTDCCSVQQSAADSLDDADHLATLASVLASPVRIRLLHYIARETAQRLCSCHMPSVFGVTQPTLSHHLAKLVDAGLIEREMVGKWAHYSIAPGARDLVSGLTRVVDV